MIDEKRLSEIEQGCCLVPIPLVRAWVQSCHEYSVKVCDCERQELVRLARLGLWAQEKGIPALECGNKIQFNGKTGLLIESTWDIWQEKLQTALAALPGKKGE